MEEYMADNAGMATEEATEIPEDGVAAVTEETGQEPIQEQTEPEEAPLPEQPEQEKQADITSTQAFSRRLNEMTQRRMDEFIAGLGYQNPYTNKPIKTQAEYEQYKRMYEAEQRGSDPVLAAQVADMNRELMGYRLRDQDMRLQSDPERGEIYRELREQVLGLVDFCHSRGQMAVDVNTAFNTVLSQNLSRIIGRTKTQSEQEAVKKLTANKVSSPGPLGAGGDNEPLSFDKMSDKEFERYVAMVERGELKKS